MDPIDNVYYRNRSASTQNVYNLACAVLAHCWFDVITDNEGSRRVLRNFWKTTEL